MRGRLARVDYDRMAPAYDAGRGRTLDQLRPWREALTEFLPRPCGCRGGILDLGAGTGQWAAALAGWFEQPVVGVEPSAGMRAAAAAKHLDRVLLVGGRAEAIPLAAGACSAAWLSLVLHHLDDPAQCAEELRRVLCLHGLVLVRSAFPDAGELLDLSLLLRFFPGAKRVLASFPPLDDTVALFERAGFALVATRGVAELAAVSLRDALGRMRLRADTVLRQIPDAEFHQGLRQLEQAAAAEDPERPPAPLFGRLPLVAFARQHGSEG
jgi:ubiquinone/menaquinone biosynthesis C-methylase UbiE